MKLTERMRIQKAIAIITLIQEKGLPVKSGGLMT